MACSRSVRLVAVVSALLIAASAGATRASESSCSETGGIRVQDARLLIVPNVGTGSAQLTLSGHALIADPESVGGVGRALCAASIGEKLSVDKTEICRLFGGLSGEDSIKPDGNAVEFSLSKSLGQQSQPISIDLPAGEAICAFRLIVEVRPGPQGHFAYITQIPKSLSGDHAEFEIATGAHPRDLKLQVYIDRDPGAAVNERAMNAPKSWDEPIEGVHLQWLVHALLLSFVIALFLTLFEKAHPLRATFGSVSTYLKSPVTAAMALYTAGALMEFVGNAGYVILRRRPGDMTLAGLLAEQIRSAAKAIGVTSLNAPTELAFLAIILVGAFFVYFLLVRPICGRGPIGRAIAFPFLVTLYAALISVAGMAFAMLMLWKESELQWFGYQGPALFISLFYALIGVGSLRHLFGLSKSQVIWIAALVALTALFPTEPVVRSTVAASIADNTRIWARFLCSVTANFVYIAALTGFAFRLAGSDELHDRLVAQWLVFLLILMVAAFALGNPTNTVAVAGVVLVSSRWLLAPSDERDEAAIPSSRSGIDWEQEEESFPLVVGGTAAFIFLIQFTFQAGATDLNHRFALLGLANVPRTFAVAAVAAVVLSRAGPYLRGDAATLKAANISALFLLTNIASSLVSLQGRLFAVLAGNLGVIASLILCALIVYDLQRARDADGQFEWRDLFQGTTLAQGVPIVSAVVIALFSALSPIFMHEFSDSVASLLKTALSQAQPAGSAGN